MPQTVDKKRNYKGMKNKESSVTYLLYEHEVKEGVRRLDKAQCWPLRKVELEQASENVVELPLAALRLPHVISQVTL